MSTEPTSSLVCEDLLLEVARSMGVAFYGADGTEPAQIPEDDHDLAECLRHVNNGIRMFIADAPPTGWRWTRPTASTYLWPDVAVDASRTVTGAGPANDETLITANSSVFYESMEEKTLVVTGQGSFVIKRYVSPTQVYVYGNHGFVSAATYSIASEGNYTLPRTFAGEFTGGLSFGASTNRAIKISWADEATIRLSRENVSVNTGTPILCGLSVFQPQSGRRRYQLVLYPTPDELFTVQFPFALHFDSLTDPTDSLPTPIAHDETIRAACLAVVDRDVNDVSSGPNWDYYRNVCLANSHNIDARSGPRKLGYFGNNRVAVNPGNFRDFMQRPNVVYNTP